MARSLRVRGSCIERVKLAVKRNGFPSQAALAIQLGRAKATVDKFLNGKPVDFYVFEELCSELGLDWKEVADLNIQNEPAWHELGDWQPINPPGSDIYVDRPPIEADCYQAIAQPGILIRIKAPRQMGKTSLMFKILQQANGLEYTAVPLSFQLADGAVLSNRDKFLKWFCAALSKELGLNNHIDKHWDEILSSNYNATTYVQNYILSQIHHPLVLALDNTDLVFEHAEIATEFCKLLRNWHDQARRSYRTSQLWQRLRLIILHATEVYRTLDINSSPLAGVGLVMELPDFNAAQVLNFAQRHGLDWTKIEVAQLMQLVEGHPYLTQLMLQHIKQQATPLEQVLQKAHTETGIYSNHLRQLLGELEQTPELLQIFRDVVMAEAPVPLKSAQAFKLHSMGLVKLDGNHAKPRCLLYRKYFQEAFAASV
ncbi:MAG: AAA-like domain-containing protein [Oscillatoriales cyanobacterium C42_A2020_001]|nr:AAA-like domain-containing protein [Leptolyngbyaceae cyanobacterium C42_A2020_001]